MGFVTVIVTADVTHSYSRLLNEKTPTPGAVPTNLCLWRAPYVVVMVFAQMGPFGPAAAVDALPGRPPDDETVEATPKGL